MIGPNHTSVFQQPFVLEFPFPHVYSFLFVHFFHFLSGTQCHIEHCIQMCFWFFILTFGGIQAEKSFEAPS